MAIGDITIYSKVPQNLGGLRYNVAANATAINAGEPVTLASITATSVVAGVTSAPVTGTATAQGLFVGVATTSSTQTATANGSIEVLPVTPGVVYLVAPKTAATWNTQTKYNDLVGTRVTLDLTGGVYTINAADGASNGCVVMPLDITKYPGKVAFQFKQSVSYANN